MENLNKHGTTNRVGRETPSPVREQQTHKALPGPSLARFFGTELQFWRNLQSRFDLEVTDDKLAGLLIRARTSMRIIEGDLGDPRIVELLRVHLNTATAQTARGSAHALDVSGLGSPAIDFWSLWDSEELLGIGALKQISTDHGEIKSMHVAQSRRRTGAGSALLAHIIASARGKGMRRLSLETGSWDYFRPARALYRKHGFSECAPFGDYRPDPNSVFLALELTADS